MYLYPHRPRKPKLPPSGPPAPPRREICILKPRTSIPRDEVLAEMIELMPPWLQEQARAEIPRQIYAEAAGQPQLLPTKRTAQTTFLEQTQGKDDE